MKNTILVASLFFNALIIFFDLKEYFRQRKSLKDYEKYIESEREKWRTMIYTEEEKEPHKHVGKLIPKLRDSLLEIIGRQRYFYITLKTRNSERVAMQFPIIEGHEKAKDILENVSEINKEELKKSNMYFSMKEHNILQIKSEEVEQ